ncbi:hypothetical protein [Variovorax sp. YR752]|uniref:hypothetical protein n=1 Tax=Variovorax sp. YR752 TaxID=1884383 RepID=UPI003137912C
MAPDAPGRGIHQTVNEEKKTKEEKGKKAAAGRPAARDGHEPSRVPVNPPTHPPADQIGWRAGLQA